MNKNDASRLRLRLKKIGLSDPAISAAWPTWWSADAEASTSARAELRFSLARKLGLDPMSLLDDDQAPRFVWRDDARFKNLSGEGEIELSAITSFGTALGTVLVASSPEPISIAESTASDLRRLLLRRDQPYIRLHNLLSLSWSLGIPVVHLRVFPWPQKRMAAMTVRVADRCAILLGKDAMYPAHIAFYLAHELGHIALGHLSSDRVIVDLEELNPKLATDDVEEDSADRFALELLTGEPKLVVLPSRKHYAARELARIAMITGEQLGIEPGTLVLCFGYSTGNWPAANAALRYIYAAPKPVWKEVNDVAWSQLALDRISDDSTEYLRAVLGESGSL
jgi:Zn-dependent peptidase ImmA (M78 family)